jgi:ribosomal protein S15P/S13E
MSELEKLLNKLPKLADRLKLTIGSDASEILQEINRIERIQKKLNKIEKGLEEELDDERFNQGFLKALPMVGFVASWVIPGGFLLDSAIAAGGSLLAEKLGDPDREMTLEDLAQQIEDLVEWGDWLQELAQKLLADASFFLNLQEQRQYPSLPEQIEEIDESLRVHLDYDEETVLSEQIKQIKTAQKELSNLQVKLDKTLQGFDEDVEDVRFIEALTYCFGELVFTLEWYGDEGIIISCGGENTSSAIIHSKCQSLKQQTDNLIDRANKLRGEAARHLKQLEEERRHQLEEERRRQLEDRYRADEVTKSETESKNQAQERLDRERIRKEIEHEVMLSQQQKRGALGWVSIFTTLAAGIVGFLAWRTGFQLPEFQQAQQQQTIPANTIASATSEDKSPANTIANWETSQRLAMEASTIVQNPPHPVEVWEQAAVKWQEAIALLEEIPEDSSGISPKAKQKLASYQTNYTAISNRLATEQKAAADMEAAKKLAWEAAVMVQNPPHPQQVWQNAQSKLQESINLLEAIPQGTFVKEEAEGKVADYRINYDIFTKRVAAGE